MREQRYSRIPIVTIGGFLGAGKTTLINHILHQAEDQRIIVFVNDFGTINIDYDLIEAEDANRISLKNGCICCTLNEDLIATLKSFLDDETKPDAFVIEASGIADPRALDRSIALLEKAGRVRSDNRVYLVDTDQFLQVDYEDSEAIIDHAAAADLLLLNKCDLTAPTDIERIENLFAKSASNTFTIKTKHCECDLDLVLGQGLSEQPTKVLDADRSLTRHHGFVSWSRETDQKIDRSRFEEFAKRLASTSFRAKGRIFFEQHGSRPSIFHLVGNRASLEASVYSNGNQKTSVVAIGKSKLLDQGQLDQWFEEIMASQNSHVNPGEKRGRDSKSG